MAHFFPLSCYDLGHTNFTLLCPKKEKKKKEEETKHKDAVTDHCCLLSVFIVFLAVKIRCFVLMSQHLMSVPHVGVRAVNRTRMLKRALHVTLALSHILLDHFGSASSAE